MLAWEHRRDRFSVQLTKFELGRVSRFIIFLCTNRTRQSNSSDCPENIFIILAYGCTVVSLRVQRWFLPNSAFHLEVTCIMISMSIWIQVFSKPLYCVMTNWTLIFVRELLKVRFSVFVEKTSLIWPDNRNLPQLYTFLYYIGVGIICGHWF